MREKTPEDTLSKLRRENKIYRDRIHVLEQKLAMRNDEAQAYQEEALYYHEKEKRLLQETADITESFRLYFEDQKEEAQKEEAIFSHYPKWVHWLFGKKALRRT